MRRNHLCIDIMLSDYEHLYGRYHDIICMNELKGHVFDNEESYPIPGYEVTVRNWIEQLRSATSVDELIELEEI
jgi:hypothetical protein